MEEEKRLINYRKIFKKPIVMYSLGNVRLPFGIPLRQSMYFAVIFCVLVLLKLTLFRALFNSLTGSVLYYVLPSLLISRLLSEDYALLSGKPLHNFLWDTLKYQRDIKLPNKKFIHDREAKNVSQAVKMKIR